MKVTYGQYQENVTSPHQNSVTGPSLLHQHCPVAPPLEEKDPTKMNRKLFTIKEATGLRNVQSSNNCVTVVCFYAAVLSVLISFILTIFFCYKNFRENRNNFNFSDEQGFCDINLYENYPIFIGGIGCFFIILGGMFEFTINGPDFNKILLLIGCFLNMHFCYIVQTNPIGNHKAKICVCLQFSISVGLLIFSCIRKLYMTN